ncbi:DUF1707 domain-containing protein [Pseudonocardia sp. H11422]|uniref:DUF1707 domain-containing protein n=1 Tax=Pseudonocardia sp. H11422 TaxID=2835866 RepID=UPI0027E29B71|nr:DUF1707 domain-containing protein [Pseudonocardia sp. H11422]
MSTEDPRPLRIGHDEREAAVRALGDHFARGRLDPSEFEERVAQAYAARTRTELDALFGDLPSPPTPAAPPYHPAPVHQPGAADPAAPFGCEPVSGRPYSDKSKVAAGVLQLCFGWAGVGRFYTGHVGLGIAQLIVTLITLGIGGIWGFIDGIVLLAGRPTDPQGRPLRS